LLIGEALLSEFAKDTMLPRGLRPEQVIQQGCEQDVRAQLVLDQGLRAQLFNGRTKETDVETEGLRAQNVKEDSLAAKNGAAQRAARLASETDEVKRARLDADNARKADQRAALTKDAKKAKRDAYNAARLASENDEG
jgi:hypothetical protein